MYPKKSRGFLDAARRLIEKHPGLTAKEIVTGLLESGEATSYAQNPVLSLTATLQKHYMDIGVERRKEGVFRFYPEGITVFLDTGEVKATLNDTRIVEDSSSNGQTSRPSGTDEVEITIRLPRVIVDILGNAVTSGRYANRNEAIQRLLQRGLGAGA